MQRFPAAVAVPVMLEPGDTLSLAITIAQLAPFQVPRLTPSGIWLSLGLVALALVIRNTVTLPACVTENGCVYAELCVSVPEKVSVRIDGSVGPVGVLVLLLLPPHADAIPATRTIMSTRKRSRRIEMKAPRTLYRRRT